MQVEDDRIEENKETEEMVQSDKISVMIKVDSKVMNNAVFCCGLNIGDFSRGSQFMFLSSGVMIFYIVYGYVQEWIFRLPSMKSHGYIYELNKLPLTNTNRMHI